MEIAINITGGTYKHESLPISAQTTRNLWPQVINNPVVSDKYVLRNFVGQDLFSTQSGTGRGAFVHKSLLYRVAGTKLYSIDSAGISTELGAIDGNADCIFDSLNEFLLIATEQKIYVWNSNTLTLSQVTDPDLESPSSVAVLNNQAIYDGDNARFGVSDVGDPFVIDGLSYATAESKGDDLLRVFVFRNTVYMMGTSSIEQWWNSGVGKPPFDRIEGGNLPIGLGALHGIDSNNNFVYFLGDDRRVYRMSGQSIEPVTNYAIKREFEGYATISDAKLWCMDINNTNFTVCTFPSANKTWVYIEGGDWFEWSSGLLEGRNKANSYVYAYNKHLVEDYQNGNLYELKFDSYTENGEMIAKQRDTAPISNSALGVSGKWVYMQELTLLIESGVGLLEGQGENPQVMMSYSDDGGKTFSTERWAELGRKGDFTWEVKWKKLGRFKERVLRFKITDSVKVAIRKCVAKVEAAI